MPLIERYGNCKNVGSGYGHYLVLLVARDLLKNAQKHKYMQTLARSKKEI